MTEVNLAELQEFFKKFVNAGTYDTCLKNVNIVAVHEAQIIAEMKVTKECCNAYGTLHGGFIATIVDVLTAFAMTIHPSKPRSGVSVDLNISYLRKSDINDTIVIDARTVKLGTAIGFAEAIITDKETGDIVAKGQHTRYVGSTNKFKLTDPENNFLRTNGNNAS